MRLNLTLRKGKTTIFFTNPIRLNQSVLKVNRAKIIWTLYNVQENEKVLLDSTEHDVLTGYYSFDDLKDFLENINCTVVLEKSGKVTLTPPTGKTLNLKNMGKLLGFNKDASFDDKQTSPTIVDVHGGLKYISLFCNRINTYRNFEMGQRSEKMCDISIPNGNLFGVFSNHVLETSSSLENGEISSIEFTVKDNSFLTNKDSYSIHLDCEIN